MSEMNFQNIPSKYVVKREREVAYESPDYIMPWGTRWDNSRNWRFNNKLYKLFQHLEHPFRVLDMGCSGGGFVKDCVDDGCLAVGLEGSDYSKKLKRAEWGTIPEYLFTCDLTGDFEIFGEINGAAQRMLFDVITSWEVIEHIAEKDIPAIVANVRKHLAAGGRWIMSVATTEDVVNGVRLHQTVKPKKWWVQRFSELGFEQRDEYVKYFNTQFVRGPKYGAPGSFILVLTVDKSNLPALPFQPLIRQGFEFLYDRWLGSFPQKLLKLLVGERMYF